MRRGMLAVVLVVAVWSAPPAAAEQPVDLPGKGMLLGDEMLLRNVMPLLKTRCVKCHGPATAEGELNLSTPATIVRGGESGPAISPGQLDASLLWQRVTADEMPPEEPLPEDEKRLLQRWIAAGAPGLPQRGSEHISGDHWAFVPLAAVTPPEVAAPGAIENDVDRFLAAELARHGVSPVGPTDRATLIRRVALDLTGLPPTPEEIDAFERDTSVDAYARLVDRYLASPRYGERYGKLWLDAAGYADSNGYFNADSDRPLAYRYRDYVVRAFNDDKPFDRFVQEQIAGDELAQFKPGQPASAEVIALLEATHYLRNAQDGTGESDGNDDEVKNDRYAALDGCLQIVSSSLLGLTVQCAKCHDHKFEPLSQRDYYQWQAVFYPALNIEDWLKPNDRVVQAALPGELEAWQASEQEIDAEIARLRGELAAWQQSARPPAVTLFEDAFVEGGPPLADLWSATAPGDDGPGGLPPVNLDVDTRPAALARDGALHVLDNGADGVHRWVSTKQAFDWAPADEGSWIEVTFDLVDWLHNAAGNPPERVGYFLATHDHDDSGLVPGGNLLLEGKPDGGVGVYLDYPGDDHEQRDPFGAAKYEPGHNYGVRVTRLADGQCRIDHLYDGAIDGEPLMLAAESLPPGGFGFVLCCDRSFVVDNVRIVTSDPAAAEANRQYFAELQQRRERLEADVRQAEQRRTSEPGRIAWTTDRSATPPEVHLLERGSHASPGERVQPAPLAALAEEGEVLAISLGADAASTGTRLAWARWVTDGQSRAGALLARVQVNRLWQQHFGRGIVATTDNLGVSGAAPSHPELLEYLAGELVRSGWSIKHMHRLMLHSAAYQRAATADAEALAADPGNRLLWRWSTRRLDAETLRDAVLAVSGQLDEQMGGPYVPTVRDAEGEVVVKPSAAGAQRRSLYLQQRRTQTLSLLGVFDAPSLVFNCVERPVSTIPLQSLSLLNSPFQIEQARHFALRIAAEAGDDAEARVDRAFRLAMAREPTAVERQAALEFVASQQQIYRDAESDEPEQRAWSDFCQMLLASSAFLYIE